MLVALVGFIGLEDLLFDIVPKPWVARRCAQESLLSSLSSMYSRILITWLKSYILRQVEPITSTIFLGVDTSEAGYQIIWTRYLLLNILVCSRLQYFDFLSLSN